MGFWPLAPGQGSDLHVSTLSDLQRAFARLRPAQGTIARFLVLLPRLKALSDPLPLELKVPCGDSVSLRLRAFNP